MLNIRVGLGYDVHRLTENRPLILGGVKIDYSLGLAGHSDADVLVHAIMDSILGALALGDIGQHFPDTDPAYKNISSLKLLEKVRDLMIQEGYQINNVDSIIIAQKPKLAHYIPQMQKNIAEILALESNQVGIKATTEEGLGFTGRGEGIAAQAIVSLLYKEV